MDQLQHLWHSISKISVSLVWVAVIQCLAAILIYLLASFRAVRRWNRLYRSRAQAVVKGLVNEQFAPLMANFPGAPSDARFIGKPVDYIVFSGLSEGSVDEIIFVEVKSRNRAGLTPNERRVRDAVENARVRWMVYSVENAVLDEPDMA